MNANNDVAHNTELDTFLKESDASLQLARENGIVVDRSHWLTIKRYAQRYNLTTQVVTNWINRGIIPTDCVMDLPELNDIRLVKDRTYR